MQKSKTLLLKACLRFLSHEGLVVKQDPENLETRKNIMWTATDGIEWSRSVLVFRKIGQPI